MLAVYFSYFLLSVS